MSAVDKLANHVDSPLARFRKLSPATSHAFNEYPLFYETVNWLLSIAIVNYAATFVAHVVLSFKTDLLDKVVPQVYDFTSGIDSWFTSAFLVGVVDKYIPLAKSLHYKDLKPRALKASAEKALKELVELLKAQFVSVQANIKSTADPLVANTVSSVNPVLAPVNKTLESVIELYLPTKQTSTPTINAKDSNEVTKLISLTRDATGRTITVVQTTASKAMKLPSDITGHVSKIYGSELKEHNGSIPSAIVHTSSELVSEVTTNLGLKNKAGAAAQVVQAKVNGVIEEAATYSSAAVDAVAETVETSAAKASQVTNGSISVGA